MQRSSFAGPVASASSTSSRAPVAGPSQTAQQAPPKSAPSDASKTTPSAPAKNEPTVWYLAYGSNMNSKVFEVRRGIKPIERAPCKVPGYELNFHIAGIPYLEPSFASVEEIPGGPRTELHGVVYKITQKDYETVRRTEGGGGHDGVGYGARVVKCTTYDGRVVDAVTLVATPGSTRLGADPSRRYRELLVEGATQHGLRPEYVAYLSSLPAYEARGASAIAGRVALVVAATVPLLPFILAIIACRLLGWKSPRWVHTGVAAVSRGIWILHDHALAPLFGRGDRAPPKSQ
eukprot:tig00020961_g16686.t1